MPIVIFIAADSNDGVFIDTIRTVVDEILQQAPGTLKLICNSRNWDGDTGDVMDNSLRVTESDLVLYDITPNPVGIRSSDDPTPVVRCNEGVLIEYGMIVATMKSLNERAQSIPTPRPLPTHRLFLADNFERSAFSTPLISQTNESIAAYNSGNLAAQVREIIQQKLREFSDIRGFQPVNRQTTQYFMVDQGQ